MSTTQNSDLIDEMLLQIETGKRSMSKQIGSISDIIEKSNNVLLQIEATQSMKLLPNTPNVVAHSYSKETLHSLATIMQLYQKIVTKETCNNSKDQQNGDNAAQPPQQSLADFETFLLSNRQKMETLGGSVRKLLAINDTVTQMKTNLQNHLATSDENI